VLHTEKTGKAEQNDDQKQLSKPHLKFVPSLHFFSASFVFFAHCLILTGYMLNSQLHYHRYCWFWMLNSKGRKKTMWIPGGGARLIHFRIPNSTTDFLFNDTFYVW